MAKEMKFEESLRRLEEIVDQLEGGDLSLDDSLKLFEEGMALSKACAEKLNRAEERVQKLIKDEEGEFRLEPLDAD